MLISSPFRMMIARWSALMDTSVLTKPPSGKSKRHRVQEEQDEEQDLFDDETSFQ